MHVSQFKPLPTPTTAEFVIPFQVSLFGVLQPHVKSK